MAADKETQKNTISSFSLPDYTKSICYSTGNTFSTITNKAIDNLLLLIKKQIAHIKELSENYPTEAITSLESLSVQWINLPFTSNATNDIVNDLLSACYYIQQHCATRTRTRLPLSAQFLSSVSDTVVTEIVGGVSENNWSITRQSRTLLWTIDVNSYEKMLLATLKHSLSCSDPYNALVNMLVKNITTDSWLSLLLIPFTVDYYWCVYLMTIIANKTINNLAYKMYTYLLDLSEK